MGQKLVENMVRASAAHGQGDPLDDCSSPHVDGLQTEWASGVAILVVSLA